MVRLFDGAGGANRLACKAIAPHICLTIAVREIFSQVAFDISRICHYLITLDVATLRAMLS